MYSGFLRDSVTVERQDADLTDSYGNPTPGGWVEHIAAQPCKIVPKGGSEDVLADRLTGVIKFEVILRWSTANAAILDEDRFVLARDAASLASGTVLNIRHRGVDPTGKRRELRFMVESGVAT